MIRKQLRVLKMQKKLDPKQNYHLLEGEAISGTFPMNSKRSSDGRVEIS